MRILCLLLLVAFVSPQIAVACDVPEKDQPLTSPDKDSQEALAWPPKPDSKLVQGMWLAAADERSRTLLWLKEDGSWTTAWVVARSVPAEALEEVESVEGVNTSNAPWHIAQLDDPKASYGIVLGQPRPTRCGPGSMHAPTYPIARVTAMRLAVRSRDKPAEAVVYQRAEPNVAAQIDRLVAAADEAAKARLARSGESLADGIYAVQYEGQSDQGKKVRRTDGAEIILAERLTDRFGEAAMFSVTNDNTRFALDLKRAGPIPAKRSAPYFVAVVGGYVMGVAGHSDPHPDGTMDFGVQVFGVEAAKAVEQSLKIAARRRSHPGHRLLTTWKPAKPSYRVGEPVTLQLQIKNVGDKPVTFRVGGQQRGPRDNQFRFLAYRSGGYGKAITDSGDPTNFGGISGWQDLKPSDVFSRDVDLSHWFKFTEPDSYRITGLYELELFDQKPDASHGNTIWEDFAIGECSVYVEGPSPADKRAAVCPLSPVLVRKGRTSASSVEPDSVCSTSAKLAHPWPAAVIEAAAERGIHFIHRTSTPGS
jgi:hypothetical protein